MKTKGKKFISPGAWFSLEYPGAWSEFEDMEDVFLFYNPDKWSGNFRISAYKADPKYPGAKTYGQDSVKDELKSNSSASLVKIGNWNCAYSAETFQEEGTYYTTHIWFTGMGNISFECSFTVPKGGDRKPAEEIIASLEVREEGKRYPAETIPVRVLEIGIINEAYEWAVAAVKKQLKKDFTGTGEDIDKLQQMLDSDSFNANQRDAWYAFGTAFGVILTNEIDGLDWVTMVDGNKEFPVLRFMQTDVIVNPRDLVWVLMKNNKSCNLKKEFEQIKGEVEKVI